MAWGWAERPEHFWMSSLLEKRSGTESVSVKGREAVGKKGGREEQRD